MSSLLLPWQPCSMCKEQGSAWAPLGQLFAYQGTQLPPQAPAGRVWTVLDWRQGRVREVDLVKRVWLYLTHCSITIATGQAREKAIMSRDHHWTTLMAFPAPGWWDLEREKRALSHPRLLCPMVCSFYAAGHSTVLPLVTLLKWLFMGSLLHFVSIGTAIFWIFCFMTLAEASFLCSWEHGCVCMWHQLDKPVTGVPV